MDFFPAHNLITNIDQQGFKKKTGPAIQEQYQAVYHSLAIKPSPNSVSRPNIYKAQEGTCFSLFLLHPSPKP
jgi:hypothetical protein